MSTRRDVAGPLQLAASHALLAHRALGRMSVSSTVAEFSEATVEFMAAARGVSQSVAVLVRGAGDGAGIRAAGGGGGGGGRGRGGGSVASERRRAFHAWFANEVAGVLQHPMQSEVVKATHAPAVYVSRAARGSEQPAIREVSPVEGTPIGRLSIAVVRKPRPEDFYFEAADTRPAIVMCAEYLERVTSLLDQSKAVLRRLGLE